MFINCTTRVFPSLPSSSLRGKTLHSFSSTFKCCHFNLRNLTPPASPCWGRSIPFIMSFKHKQSDWPTREPLHFSVHFECFVLFTFPFHSAATLKKGLHNPHATSDLTAKTELSIDYCVSWNPLERCLTGHADLRPFYRGQTKTLRHFLGFLSLQFIVLCLQYTVLCYDSSGWMLVRAGECRCDSRVPRAPRAIYRCNYKLERLLPAC